MEVLLAHGADPKCGHSPLEHAVLYGRHNRWKARQPEVVRLLLEHGAEVNVQDKYGHTPLHAAVLGAGTDTMQLLLEAGADRNLTDAEGDTAEERARALVILDKAEMLRNWGTK